MNQLQKYIWLIETIRRVGKISLKELSDRWEESEYSDCKPLNRTTFNRWKDDVFSQFGIIISCQRVGGYMYYIQNPEDIDDNKLKKWMLDSFAVGNLIGENLALKDRIVVDNIPSGHEHLTTILAAMTDNRVINITYKPFTKDGASFPVNPYCVKLFQNRWYLVAGNEAFGDTRIYGLDRVEKVEIQEERFKMPKKFNATDFFGSYYGIVADGTEPQRIVLRADSNHKHYLQSLPLHYSQQMIADEGDYADFELYVAPTYDFVMQLLHSGPMLEVIYPDSLRKTMKEWITGMYDKYK